MTKRPVEEKLGINQREFSLSFGNRYGQDNANELYNMIFIRFIWRCVRFGCLRLRRVGNAVMFLSCIPLRDAFGLSVVVLYLLIFFHQTWIVKLAWRGFFYHWTLKEARKSSFWTEWACSILEALPCFEGCFLMLRLFTNTNSPLIFWKNLPNMRVALKITYSGSL